jgi:hypothetical protein
VDQAAEIVKCVSDDADVTDVNIGVPASRGMLPTWELIVICRTLVSLTANSDCGPTARRAPAASTSLLADTSATSLRMKGATVEVKIGITDSPRELVFSSTQTPGEVEDLVSAALREGSGLVSLIAYVEIGAADARRVGFGIGADSTARTGGKAAKSD